MRAKTVGGSFWGNNLFAIRMNFDRNGDPFVTSAADVTSVDWTFHEAYVSTERSAPQASSRISPSDANPCRSHHHQTPPSQGTPPSQRLAAVDSHRFGDVPISGESWRLDAAVA